jgi:hypothetical protein
MFSPNRRRISGLALLLTSALVFTGAAPLPRVVPDLDRRLAQWHPVAMTFDTAALSERERQMLDKLVSASREVEQMYWLQGDPDGFALWKSLATERRGARPSAEEVLGQKVRHMLWIQGSRFDLLDEHKPFVGEEPMAPGRALFPRDLSRAEFEAYVAAHPEQKAALYDEHTVVTRGPNKTLVATPYHVVYKPYLERAAADLRAAAELSDDALFKKFLTLRAEALLTDDYLASDLAWLDLQNPKFDIIFAPYETYLDDFLGVKTSWGAAVMVRNEAESKKLEVFQKWVPDLQDALPLAAEDRPSKRGLVASMEVMDTPFRAGDLRHGYQAAADNLPNDPRVHEKKGSKRIFFKNYTDARVDYVILPVAKLLMMPADAALASGEGYLTAVMMHEISHGLGPAYARQQDGGAGPEGRSGGAGPEGRTGGAGPEGRTKQVDIRVAIGPGYSGLEEAKADIVGMWGLHHMAANGGLAKERLAGIDASFVAGIFRTVRFGTAEAHGKAEMMEFNYFVEKGALVKQGGRYGIDSPKFAAALATLAKELLEIEATGDRARAEAWFAKYGAMPADLKAALDAAKDIPVDIDPQQPYAELAP